VADKGWIWFATAGASSCTLSRPTRPRTSRRHRLCLQVADMDATRARLEADGAAHRRRQRILGRERLFTRDGREPGRTGRFTDLR
jgi:hypothetical protein